MQTAPEPSLPQEASQDTAGQKTVTELQEGGSVSAKGTPDDKAGGSGGKMAGAPGEDAAQHEADDAAGNGSPGPAGQ